MGFGGEGHWIDQSGYSAKETGTSGALQQHPGDGEDGEEDDPSSGVAHNCWGEVGSGSATSLMRA